MRYNVVSIMQILCCWQQQKRVFAITSSLQAYSIWLLASMMQHVAVYVTYISCYIYSILFSVHEVLAAAGIPMVTNIAMTHDIQITCDA